jgi:hypothetical protein
MFPPLPQHQHQQPPPPKKLVKWPAITDHEVKKAILSSHPRKAPGPDGIPFLIIHKAYDICPLHFNELYRKLATHGYHPVSWRESITAVIRKQGKPDYSNPKAYRPVALLNCLGKVLEKIFATRLSFLAELEDLLHPSQIGGRKQRSAIDAVMSLVHDIDLSKRNKTVTSALLMDVKGAFDNVSKDRLLHTMFSLGLPPSLLSWTNHFMTYRKTSLAFDGNREPLLPVQTGIPQGSPISPILFLIYLRPLFDELNARYPFAQCPSYIDDVAIVVEGRNEIENARLLGEIARYVFTWADKNAITFDGPKTELIHFIRRRQPSPDPDSSVYLPNGSLIEPSSCVRWLGVWLDSRLSFHNHIKAKTTAATRSYFALRRLANTQKGLTVSIMRQLYISTVLPILDYGSEVWWMGQKTSISKLITVQNGAMRSILGAFKTTPIAALES